MKKHIIIEARREGYGIDQINRTMTVRELIDYLEQFDDDSPIYLSHDNGYTYGGIRESRIEESGDEFTHSIVISEQRDIPTETGDYKGTEEIAVPVNQEDCERPNRESFYSWLCALYPQYEWMHDDGDDWDEDDDTDYCQYLANIDDNDPTHILLAVYNKTKVEL